MIFFILLTCFIFGLGFMSFITYIYNYMIILIHISETRFNYISYDDYYIVNEILSNNHIVFLNNNELKSYYCNIAYNTIEDSKLHLYCCNYNINKKYDINCDKNKQIFYNVNKKNVELLSNYICYKNVKILKDKLNDDIVNYISKFIFNIELNNKIKIII